MPEVAEGSEKKREEPGVTSVEQTTPSNKIVEKIASAFFMNTSGSKTPQVQTKNQVAYPSIERKSDSDNEVELNDELEEIQTQPIGAPEEEREDEMVEGSGSGEVPASNHTDYDTGDGRNDNNDNLNTSCIFVGEGEDSERKVTRELVPKKQTTVSIKTRKLIQMQRTREKTQLYLRNMDNYYLSQYLSSTTKNQFL